MNMTTRANNENTIGLQAECDYCAAFSLIVASHNGNDICVSCAEKISKQEKVKSAKRRFKANDDTKAHRALAKMFGGKALTGSAKQKVWGEAVRAEALSVTNEDNDIVEKVICSRVCNSASFWIDNRETIKKVKFFSLVVDNEVQLVDAINENYETCTRGGFVSNKEKAAKAFFTVFDKLDIKFPTYRDYVETFERYRK